MSENLPPGYVHPPDELDMMDDAELRDALQHWYLQADKARKYLAELTPGIGTGDDPVGTLVASHAALSHDLNEARCRLDNESRLNREAVGSWQSAHADITRMYDAAIAERDSALRRLDQVRLAIANSQRMPRLNTEVTLSTIRHIVGEKWIAESNPGTPPDPRVVERRGSIERSTPDVYGDGICPLNCESPEVRCGLPVGHAGPHQVVETPTPKYGHGTAGDCFNRDCQVCGGTTRSGSVGE